MAGTTRRWAAALLLLAATGLTACSHSSRTSAQTDDTVSLPASAIPPDPCKLVTDADISEAVGQPMRESGSATSPMPPFGERVCWWVAVSGGHTRC